jgi:peptidyl-prolyl cis-trans isomerase A (cyclophilin A)
MKSVTTFATIALLAAGSISAAFAQATLPDSPGAQVPVKIEPTGPTAVIDTSMGRITCKLFSKEAPMTVENFVALSEGRKEWTNPNTHKLMKGVSLYNGTIFHRVIPGFMIQGGDPVGTGNGDPGYYFPDEIVSGLTFDVPGRLAMANSGPGTNGSQFFITTVPTPHLDGHHTIFGQCDDAGLAVAQAIAAVPRDGQDKPDADVKLVHVTIVRGNAPIPPLQKGEPAALPAVPTTPGQ